MTLADLRRKPVVSMADGTKIGEVDDLLIDTHTWAVRELYVTGKAGRGLLPLAHLKGIGPDAVTVEQTDSIGWNAGSSGLCFASMKELHVVDGSGTVMGHVTDMVYEANGTIQSFEVRQGGVFGIGAQVTTVTPSEIRGVGEKLITIDRFVPPADLPPTP